MFVHTQDMILSVCIPYQANRDFNFLFEQNWENCECILIAETEDKDEKYNNFITELNKKVTVICADENIKNTWENNGLALASGTFWITLNPYQTWGKDFLQQIKTYVGQYFINPHLPAQFTQSDSEPYPTNLVLYGMGFVEDGGNVRFCSEIYPFLNKKTTLIRNFKKPEIFLSCITFIWPLTIIQQNNIRFNNEIRSAIIRHALFGVDVLAALYSLNNNREAVLKGTSVSLIAPLNTFSSKLDLKTYQNHVLEKWQLWEKRFFSKLNWLSKLGRINEEIKKK